MYKLSKVATYFPNLNQQQLNKLTEYAGLLAESNQQLNLISRKDVVHIETHHILHSLSIAKFKTFNQADNILDVGTGGGLPGIPLSIIFPKVQFVLIDTIEKKIKRVQWMTEQLQLNNVKAVHGRMEKLNQTFDYVISRAVTQMPKLVAWTRKLINRQKKENGMIMLKGGNIQAESAELSYPIEIIPVSTYYNEPYFEEKYIVYLKLDN